MLEFLDNGTRCIISDYPNLYLYVYIQVWMSMFFIYLISWKTYSYGDDIKTIYCPNNESTIVLTTLIIVSNMF